jgi:hypothetical protein
VHRSVSKAQLGECHRGHISNSSWSVLTAGVVGKIKRLRGPPFGISIERRSPRR